MKPLPVLAAQYQGPDFEEFCISEGSYLPASRDRSPCLLCPLCDLCQTGFEEQIRRVQRGENPSLTDNIIFSEEALSKENLLRGLTREQAEFVLLKIPSMEGKGDEKHGKQGGTSPTRSQEAAYSEG